MLSQVLNATRLPIEVELLKTIARQWLADSGAADGIMRVSYADLAVQAEDQPPVLMIIPRVFLDVLAEPSR
jgi:hypothetical protein